MGVYGCVCVCVVVGWVGGGCVWIGVVEGRCVLFVSEDCICVVSHVFVDYGRLCAIIE